MTRFENPLMHGYAERLENYGIYLDEIHVLHNKAMRVSFSLGEMPEGARIVIGHGESCYGGAFVEITDKSLTVYRYTREADLTRSAEHGLTLVGDVLVSIEAGIGFADVCLSVGDDSFSLREIPWTGRNGRVFVKSEGVALTDVDVSWYCSEFEHDIWLLGDSYFNGNTAARWPYYLINDGYTENCLLGFPGRGSLSALADFKQALEYGRPKYAVWCMGMNDRDNEECVSANWKKASDEFLAICMEKGIVPILSTVPNVPERIHSFKNDIVRASGYRYIDFAEAVGGVERGSSWYEGMLSPDLVHPDVPGAVALYRAVLRDFPEIKGKAQ